MKFNKQSLYYEAFARLSLLDLFPDKFSRELALSDRPDLQDPKKNIGVEVTRALLKSAVLAAADGDTESNEDDFSSPLTHLSKIECAFGQYKRKVFNHTQEETIQSENELRSSFLKKIKKLNIEGFKIFSENSLYIYSPAVRIFSSRAMELFTNRAATAQAVYKNRFDMVYINDFGYFYSCDLNLKRVDVRRISEKRLLDYCMEAESFAEKVIQEYEA